MVEVHAGPPGAVSQVAETLSGCLCAGRLVAEMLSGCLSVVCIVRTELPAVLVKGMGRRGG